MLKYLLSGRAWPLPCGRRRWSVFGSLGLSVLLAAPVLGWKTWEQPAADPAPRSLAGIAPADRSARSSTVLLRLRAGVFDPTRTASVAQAVPDSRSSSAEPSTHLYLVQFTGPIRSDWRRALEAAGGEVLEYLPDFAYLARAVPAVAAQFPTLPGYRWHGALESVRHVQPGLTRPAGGAAGAWRVAARQGEPLRVDVMTLPGANVRQIARRLPGRLLELSSRRRGFLRVQLGPMGPGEVLEERLASVAAIPGVAWVQPYVPPELFNDVASGLMQAPAARDELGLYGRGQVVAVADTGLDVGRTDALSADFRGRVARAYALNRGAAGDWSDPPGHGTHVCGALLGSGALSGADPAHHLYEGSFAGVAPEASLVIQSIGDAGGSLAVPSDLGQLLLRPYQNDGARIHCNSWGSGQAGLSGQYLLNSWQIDEICWQARDLVVLFAAGNSGVDANGDGVIDSSGLSSQAAAKNVITVGASESLRDQPVTWGNFSPFPSDPVQGDRLADSPAGMAAFSSRGPTADGRIKPDLVAPGTWIVSSRSRAPGAKTLWGPINADYVYSGGTSMSTPLVAGAAVLVREGLQERFGIANPSSALVKAMLISGADELAPGQYGTGTTREIPPRPNPIEGWGRVNVRQSLMPAGGVLPIDDARGLQTEERRKWSVTVTPGVGPLRVTLAWTDPPSSLLAESQLVNDLDLKLLTPEGRWLFGNSGTDRTNNVEAIELPRPSPGVYTLVVDGYNVPEGPQPFAIVAAGPIQASPGAGGGLSVRLRSTVGGLPLAGVDLNVTGSRSVTLTAGTGGQIEARLPAGSYSLTPSKPGWSFDPPVRSISVTEGQSLSLEFTGTAPGGSVIGTVTGRGGAPVAGARLTLSPGGQTVTTDASGAYRFSALPPLVCSVTPSLAGSAFTPEARRVRIPAAGTARVDFVLAAGAVTGNVVAAGPPERHPVASAHPVRTAGTQSWTVSRPGAKWIRVHFERIDVQPGVERVEVFDASGRLVNRWSGAFADVWSAWVTGSGLFIRHTASGVYARFGFAVDLVQTNERGGPVPNAAVHLQPGGQMARTDVDGFFQFTGLPYDHLALAPALNGWEFFPPVASITLPPGAPESSVTFLAQGPPSIAGQVTVTGTSQPARYESLHPYPNHSSRSQEIAVAGAVRLRLHFQRLATEFGADFVRLLAPDGKELKRYSGARNDFWTDWLPSGRVTVQLNSDDTLNDWGYLIDAVASDGRAGGSVSGASITLWPDGLTAPIGADGTYLLSDVVPGVYVLSAAGPSLQFLPASLQVSVPAWGVGGVDLEATELAAPSAPDVIASLTPDGQPRVHGLMEDDWVPLPDPDPGTFDQLLALKGANDTPELIARKEDALFHSRLVDGGWTPWQPLQPVPAVTSASADLPEESLPPAVSSFIAAAELDGTLNVLAAGPDGRIRHHRFVNGAWREPATAVALPVWKGDMAALAAREDGTLELVSSGAEGRLVHSRFSDGAWIVLGPVSDTPAALRPALVISRDSRDLEAALELAFVGEDGGVWRQRFQGESWTPPVALRSSVGPLRVSGPPAMAAGSNGRVELMAVSETGLYHAWRHEGSWSEAQAIEDQEAASVAVALLPLADLSGTLELFSMCRDGSVTHRRFRGGRWTLPILLEGLLAMAITPAGR